MKYEPLGRTRRIVGALRKGVGLFFVLAAFSGTAWGHLGAPEIDPGSAASSLALLAGGVMLVYDRYRRR